MFRRSILALVERQSVGERTLELIPFIGAPLSAATNKDTWAELAEHKKAEDPATAVQNAFWDAQTKLFAYRISRLRSEYQEFQDSPGFSTTSPLMLARTVALSLFGYLVAFNFAAGWGQDLPGIGKLIGGDKPASPAPLA